MLRQIPPNPFNLFSGLNMGITVEDCLNFVDNRFIMVGFCQIAVDRPYP